VRGWCRLAESCKTFIFPSTQKDSFNKQEDFMNRQERISRLGWMPTIFCSFEAQLRVRLPKLFANRHNQLQNLLIH
jgi:hypothetical protein